MKGVMFCRIFFILIYVFADEILAIKDPTPSSQTNSKQSVNVKLLPIEPGEISEHLTKLEEQLQIKGQTELIHPTRKEAYWIDRFIKTSVNWLKILTEVTQLESYQNEYYDILDHVFDMILPFDERTPIQIRYSKYMGPGKNPIIYTYKFIPYWICTSGFGLGSGRLKSIDIHFEKSTEKMKATDGQMVFRKDRIFNVQIEITAPSVILRADHEIIQWDEISDPDEELSKAGIMRVKLNHIKINMSLQLAEIDKRFLEKNPHTGLIYYFRLPKITDLKLTVESLRRFNIELQKKIQKSSGNTYVGKGIGDGRARKIITDITDLFGSEEGRKEICERLKPTLINKSAEAIMTSPDVLSIAKNLVMVWDTRNPKMPIVEWNPNEIKLWHQAFYSGYNTTGLLLKALNFIIAHFKNIRSKNGRVVDVLGEDPPKEYNVGKISVHYDGFDYSDNPAKTPETDDSKNVESENKDEVSKS